MWRIIYWVSPRTPEGGQAGKGDKLPPLHILRSRGAHTQLSLATFKGGIRDGNVEGIIRELAN
ncbi:phosphinothricin acetyltransferase [Capnocytophaga ochracea]|uniref:phosphinothricin acetyltransferase n=1 Tax=Capnocytophaga ochracea TaxID=1018 RepID=UPI0024201DDD|nr:phosphinothricin acetyltransferase [Capnocytophaga ochracea]